MRKAGLFVNRFTPVGTGTYTAHTAGGRPIAYQRKPGIPRET